MPRREIDAGLRRRKAIAWCGAAHGPLMQ
jgi:hypothetical protein